MGNVTDVPTPSTPRPDLDEGETLRDPYHVAPPPPPPPRAGGSAMALSAVLAAVLLGPVGAILAILFGWYARREIERSDARRDGHGLATLGLMLGVTLTPAWGALLSYLAWTQSHRVDQAAEEPAATAATAATAPPRGAPAAPVATMSPRPFAPHDTRVTREGRITVVDVGVSTTVLSDEIARQRAEATSARQTLLVMTTSDGCEPCRGFDRALGDPLMQTALAGARLLRVDIEVFHEDLDAIRIPSQRIPGFFLLAPDLTPRDGIDGGEWDDDVAPNIAPVLGAFLRGKYAQRREPWKPLPASGVAL